MEHGRGFIETEHEAGRRVATERVRASSVSMSFIRKVSHTAGPIMFECLLSMTLLNGDGGDGAYAPAPGNYKNASRTKRGRKCEAGVVEWADGYLR